MRKEIKVKILDESKLKFELLENGNSGDYFILNNDENTQTTQLITKFLETKNNLYLQEKLTIEKQKWLQNLEPQIQDKIRNKELEITNIWIEKNNNQKKQLEKEIIDLKETLTKIENEKNNIQQHLEIEYFKKMEFKTQELFEEMDSLKKINIDLEKNKINLEMQLKFQQENFKSNKEELIKNAALEAQINWLAEKEELIKKNEQLERSKGINSKTMGEELENWITDEFYNSMGLLDDSSFEKINHEINGTKADFLFSVHHTNNITKQKNKLTEITIEAKTQGKSGKNKNSQYFSTLEKNRKNNNSEYSLLVTELEPERKFLIKKIPDYENMYMIRPAYFITFLSLVRLLALKKRSIIKNEIIFKEKTEILQEFDNFKDNILNNSVKNIESQIKIIVENNDKIIKCSNNITSSTHILLNKHITTLKNKINSFGIGMKKLVRKVDKLKEEENEYE